MMQRILSGLLAVAVVPAFAFAADTSYEAKPLVVWPPANTAGVGRGVT